MSNTRNAIALPISLKTFAGLLLSLSMTGCLAPTLTADAKPLAQIQSVTVVAVEAPPLEIIPDPLNERVPARRHFDNIAMPLPVDHGIYRNAGGLLIEGQLPTADDALPGVERLDARRLPLNDFPSRIAGELCRDRLRNKGLRADLQAALVALPSSGGQPKRSLSHWQQALQDWYAQATSSVAAGDDTTDAVLEIGVARYRIFEGQVSLQVMMKLSEPRTHQVIARSRRDAFVVDELAAASLNGDSAAFKQRIAALAYALVSHNLADLGWPQAPMATALALK